jgi:hypothetical protein
MGTSAQQEDVMSSNTTVPVTITPEATEYVAELGMQREFEQMLAHALRFFPDLRSMRVNLEPAYDLELPCVLFSPVLNERDVENNPSDLDWAHWKSATFPPEIGQHFVMLVGYEAPDAR